MRIVGGLFGRRTWWRVLRPWGGIYGSDERLVVCEEVGAVEDIQTGQVWLRSSEVLRIHLFQGRRYLVRINTIIENQHACIVYP